MPATAEEILSTVMVSCHAWCRHDGVPGVFSLAGRASDEKPSLFANSAPLGDRSHNLSGCVADTEWPFVADVRYKNRQAASPAYRSWRVMWPLPQTRRHCFCRSCTFPEKIVTDPTGHPGKYDGPLRSFRNSRIARQGLSEIQVGSINSFWIAKQKSFFVLSLFFFR